MYYKVLKKTSEERRMDKSKEETAHNSGFGTMKP